MNVAILFGLVIIGAWLSGLPVLLWLVLAGAIWETISPYDGPTLPRDRGEM